MALEGIIRNFNDPNNKDPMYNHSYYNNVTFNHNYIYREPNNNNNNNISNNGFIGYNGKCLVYSVAGYNNTGNNTQH